MMPGARAYDAILLETLTALVAEMKASYDAFHCRVVADRIKAVERRRERWTRRAWLDGEAPDHTASCDFHQAARASVPPFHERPLGLCRDRHDHNAGAW